MVKLVSMVKISDHGDCGGGGNRDPDQAPVSPPDRSASPSIPLCDHSHQT